MAWKILICSIPIAGLFAMGLLFGGTPSAVILEFQAVSTPLENPALVLVNISTRTRGAKNTIEINGKLIKDYSPILIHNFPSAGIVLDRRGYIMVFLGYQWIYIQDRESRVEIVADDGHKLKGQLVGIDQRNGVAVVRYFEDKLKATPICSGCEVKDGAIVMAPILASPKLSQLHQAQVVSVGASQTTPEQEKWTLTVNRPFPDIGLPILGLDYRVLGFISSQDLTGAQAIVYPIAQLLSSADKIIRKGGDIQAGWLGVNIKDSSGADGSGVRIEDVGSDSPAQKSGFLPMDFITGYNGQKVEDARQFVQLVESTPIGSKVKLEILRRGNPMTISAIIQARKPQQIQGKLAFNLPSPPIPQASRPIVGLDTEMLDPSVAAERQISKKGGLLVVGVEDQTPAKLAGILVGDIIVSIDGKPITDSLSFSSYLETLNWGARMGMKVLRKGAERTIEIQLPPQPK
jgi:serine protease Do